MLPNAALELLSAYKLRGSTLNLIQPA